MTFGKLAEKLDLRFLLKGLAAWAVAALLSLLIASAIVSKTSMGVGPMGYISSALSFLSAFFAGAFAAKARGRGGLYAGALTAAVLCVLLLTVGFLIEGQAMEASGILSVATFSFSGSLAGSVFLGGSKRTKKTRFSPKLRR